jgi:hypothetical protein
MWTWRASNHCLRLVRFIALGSVKLTSRPDLAAAAVRISEGFYFFCDVTKVPARASRLQKSQPSSSEQDVAAMLAAG